MWQKVYSHRFHRLVANTWGQTTSCGMEKPKKFEKSWTMNEIEANFLQKFDKVEQVMKMKLRFSFPTKGIHSLNFFLVIDKFYLNLSSWWTIVSQDAFLITWKGRFKNFKPKTSITWFITSHLDVYNSMEHAPSIREMHTQYLHLWITHWVKFQPKKIYANSMSMASVFFPYCSEPTDLKSNSATFNFVKDGKMKTDTSVAHINCSLSTGFPGQM